jgi:hypothetical protein
MSKFTDVLVKNSATIINKVFNTINDVLTDEKGNILTSLKARLDS